MSRRTRRQFVRDTAALAAGAAAGGAAGQPPPACAGQQLPQNWFKSDWRSTHDRVWIGPEYWANRLQDWRIHQGRLECIAAAPQRHVHQLVHTLGTAAGRFTVSACVRRAEGELAGPGSAGFRIGVRGPLADYRHALVFGQGLDLGFTGAGKLFIGDPHAADTVDAELSVPEAELRLEGRPEGETYTLDLRLIGTPIPRVLAHLRREGVPAERLVGGLALVANFGAMEPGKRQAAAGVGRFTFDRWEATGEKLERHPARAFGPILFSQYTLSRGVLKLSVQMPPLGKKDSDEVRLDVLRDGQWKRVGRAEIDPRAHVAVFRVDDWDHTRDWPYRLGYTLLATDGQNIGYEWTGTVRRDPVDREVLTVADISCNGHMAFPNADYVANVARLNPDLLAFVGDQFYESSGGYGVQRGPLDMAILDLLRKWYLHGWTWRDLTRDRPSISLPDDHDVYQGNIWGEGGKARQGTQEMGGYDMPPEWVNVVHRTQTSHHPDPFDPTPADRGISVYYGPLVYGRVSFAILADRQFKSGPQGKVPPTGSKRGDHVVDPSYDPQSADLPGLQLLGARQMTFLRDWVRDWRGAAMKAVISQTIFTAMATTHGPDRQILVADYDAGGWPQTARNEALRELRKALAFHIAGDQHLPAVVYYGIDAHRDAIAAVAGPAVNNIYPRWFEPRQPGRNRAAGAAEHTGDFTDHFGHPLTVLAVANPQLEFRSELLAAQQDKACGIALVRFDKPRRQITVECWPFLANPLAPQSQFPGWPVTIHPAADSARRATAWLPILQFAGMREPLVQILDAAGELVYNLRPAGEAFQPHVFAPGTYAVRVADPETGREARFDALPARERNDERIEVRW